MSSSVATNGSLVRGEVGKFSDKPLFMFEAEPVQNLQAVLMDERRELMEEIRHDSTSLNKKQRRVQQIDKVLASIVCAVTSVQRAKASGLL